MSVKINLEPEIHDDMVEENPEASMAERLAELLAWESSFKKDPRFKELAKLKKEVQLIADDKVGVDGTYKLVGEIHTIEIGARALKRSVGAPEKVYDYMQPAPFFAVITVPLKAVDDYLTEEQKEDVLIVEQTGTRDIKVASTKTA